MRVEAVDRWLKDQHRQLRSGLSQLLDVGTGLREAHDQARHAELVRGLGGTLDAEAGLAAILRPRPWATPAPRATAEDGGPSAPAARTLSAVRAVRPATRLSARANPATAAGVYATLLVRVLDLAVALSLDHDRSHARARDLAHALAVALGRARDRAGDPGMAGAHARALELAHAIDVDINFDLDHLARGIAGDQAVTLAHLLAGFVEPTLAEDLDPAHTRDRERLRDLLRARTHARALAHTRTRTVATLLGLPPATKGLADALLHGALDDFTDDDLSGVDLTGADLVGILWSANRTRWPDGTDLTDLRGRSEERPPASGLFVVTKPPSVTAHR